MYFTNLKQLDRYWSYVDKTSSDKGCWLWTKTISPSGYGVFHLDLCDGRKNHPMRAHRISYILSHGSIPDSLFICHTCDVRNCVNPAHLFAGTHTENMRDKIAKGRVGNIPRGERRHNAILTEQDVLKIRYMYEHEGYNTREISEKLGYKTGTVESIASYSSWATKEQKQAYKAVNHRRVKLPREKWDEIKNLYSTGEYSQQKLADMFNTTRTHILWIIHK